MKIHCIVCLSMIWFTLGNVAFSLWAHTGSPISAIQVKNTPERDDSTAEPDASQTSKVHTGNMHTYQKQKQIDPNGNFIQGTYTNYTGTWKWYNETNFVVAKGTYANGKKTGEWIENMTPKSYEKGTYQQGKRQGEWSGYWGQYPLWIGFYKDNKLSGKRTEYYTSQPHIKHITHYKKGVLHGPVTLYYISGNIEATGHYANNLKRKKWSFYERDGTLSKEQTYHKDRLKGKEKTYYSSGVIYQKGSYRNNKKHGSWKAYHPNGQLSEKGRYAHHLKRGTWKGYHSNGGRAYKEKYTCRGKGKGLWLYYDEEGYEIRRVLYKRGKVFYDSTEP